jgi:dihydrofolate synthase / folylpolyglutamate synthase
MYPSAREYLEGITKYGSVLGLDSIRDLLKRLKNPQNDLKFVHVAGTNGKGSTVAFVSTILKTAGYKTGRYTSPSVFSYLEKIQVNGSYITKEALTVLTFQIKDVIEEMLQEGYPHPTIFEVETALAFLYFKQEACDIVVLETGLGGILDATNIVDNTQIAVLSAISKDHMEFLGDTLEKITLNKAGIIKKNSIVVSTKQEPQAMNVITMKCMEDKNPLIIAETENAFNVRYENLKVVFDYKEFKDIEIGLIGSYQIQNAILAIEVANALNKQGFVVNKEDIQTGLKHTKWPGRFSLISKEPLIIIDGAHNEAAARSLKDTLEKHFKDKKLMFVLGVFADKEYEKIVQITASLACKILTVTTPNNARALNGRILAEVAVKYHGDVQYMPTLLEAAKECLNPKEPVDAIIAFGSLSYLGEFQESIKMLQDK